jgi:hypothetical protein
VWLFFLLGAPGKCVLTSKAGPALVVEFREGGETIVKIVTKYLASIGSAQQHCFVASTQLREN